MALIATHGAAAGELVGTCPRPGRPIVLPSLLFHCHPLPGGASHSNANVEEGLTRRKRAQVGPIHRRNESPQARCALG